jgi:hypothetical protein
MNESPFPLHHIVEDERSTPPEDVQEWQPYLRPGSASLAWLERTPEAMSRESMALALSRVTAAHILPPLVEVPTGEDLLKYRVELRDVLDPILVAELGLILSDQWQALHWEKVGQQTFMFVIGAGVAATIDLTRGEEQLYLRYGSELANELYLAGRAPDLTRSRLFLQTALYERVDALLEQLRERCWQWV